MALQINRETSYGLSASAAYARVEGFRFDVRRDSLNVEVKIYYDQNARIGGKVPIMAQSFDMDLPTTEILPAIYTYLKTLPEFAGAVDA